MGTSPISRAGRRAASLEVWLRAVCDLFGRAYLCCCRGALRTGTGESRLSIAVGSLPAGHEGLGAYNFLNEETAVATQQCEAWVQRCCYRPGDYSHAADYTYVQRTVHDAEMYMVGSCYFEEE